jgi:hypothetical protein
MPTIDSITVAGNLTRDPEICYTWDGQATTSLSLAVNRRWQNQQTREGEESVSFFDVVCLRDLAENVARVSPRAPGWSSLAVWSSAAGRPTTTPSGPRPRSWPRTSEPASASPRSTHPQGDPAPRQGRA